MFSRLLRPTCNLLNFNKIRVHPFSTRSNFRIRKTCNEASVCNNCEAQNCKLQKCNNCEFSICNCSTCNNVRKYDCSPVWTCKNSCLCDLRVNPNNNKTKEETKEETEKENCGRVISFFGFFGIVGLLIGGGHLVNYISRKYDIVKQDVAENTKRLDYLEKKINK
jgi:hypothetical protein